MGCDIHAHFEIKVDGKWHHFSEPRLYRNYEMFGVMAGVRYSGATPVVEPKGLPEDLSFITNMHVKRWAGDGHTHSWFSSKELKQFLDRRDEFFPSDTSWKFEHECLGYLFGNGWDAWEKYPDDFPAEIQDIRLIFWFDN